MKKISIVFIILIVLSAFLYCEIVAGVKVTKTYGDVSVKEGDTLTPNQTIRTGFDSYVELEISPGNSVRLKENSQILIKDLDKDSSELDGLVVKLTDFNLIEGDMSLKLDNLPKGALIQVSSPTAVAGARGTAFIVRYNPGIKITKVGVLESKVTVHCVTEPAKSVLVSAYKKVSVTPWAMATAQVRGTGILSEKILGKPFYLAVSAPVMQAQGSGSTEAMAKDDAYYNLAKRILSISIAVDKRIEDILNENPILCHPLYSYISKGEVVSTNRADSVVEVTVQLPLAPISDIINRPLPPLPSTVKPVTMQEYSDKFGAQARVTTQRAAHLDGYRKLAEIMYGTVISSETTLKDMVIKDDRIRTTVEGVVKGAEILDIQYFSDGSITVSMAIRADLVRTEVEKVAGSTVCGLNYFTSPVIIDIDDFLGCR